jgi:hypothetical protein
MSPSSAKAAVVASHTRSVSSGRRHSAAQMSGQSFKSEPLGHKRASIPPLLVGTLPARTLSSLPATVKIEGHDRPGRRDERHLHEHEAPAATSSVLDIRR